MKRFSILPVVVLSAVVVACSSNSAASPSEAPATPTPTEEPSLPVASPGSSFAAPTLTEGAGDLADVLPTEVGGLEIRYQSASGDDFPSGGEVSPEEQAFLDSLGAEASDITTAFGQAIDMEQGAFITITAIRVEGADEGRLRDEFLTTMQEGESGFEGEETTVAGKSVLSVGDEQGQGYFYVNDDVVYIVGGSSADLAEEAISKLP